MFAFFVFIEIFKIYQQNTPKTSKFVSIKTAQNHLHKVSYKLSL